MPRYLTLTEASQRLGRPRQFKLMRFLIKQERIAVVQVGNTVGVPPKELTRLRDALKRWDERPRVAEAV